MRKVDDAEAGLQVLERVLPLEDNLQPPANGAAGLKHRLPAVL